MKSDQGEGDLNLCTTCTIFAQHQRYQTQRAIQPHKFYLLCSQGHIKCGTCISLHKRDKNHDQQFQKCPVDGCSGGRISKSIEVGIMGSHEEVLFKRFRQRISNLQNQLSRTSLIPQDSLERNKEQSQVAIKDINFYHDTETISILQKEILVLKGMLLGYLQCSLWMGMIIDVICSLSHFVALPIQLICFSQNFNQFSIGFCITYIASYVVQIFTFSYAFRKDFLELKPLKIISIIFLGVPALLYIYFQAFIYAPRYIYSTIRGQNPTTLCGKYCYISLIQDIKLILLFFCISTMNGLPSTPFNLAVKIILITDLIAWILGDLRICFIQNIDPNRFKYSQMQN